MMMNTKLRWKPCTVHFGIYISEANEYKNELVPFYLNLFGYLFLID